jgi:hypothetical protein
MARLDDLEAALIAADRAGNVEDATRLASAIVTTRSSQSAPINPVDEMSGSERFLAGAGKAYSDIGTGVGQLLGNVSQADVDAKKKIDAPLVATGSGLAGNITGSLVTALPALAAPATVPVAAGVGAILAGTQPVASDESRLLNMGVGAGLGGAGQWGIGKLAGIAGSKLANAEQKGASQAAQNAVRDDTLRTVQEAGYKTPPSLSGGSKIERALEGLSGKVKTQQAMAVENQNLTNSLARKALGLAEDAPLTRETMQAVRNDAFAKGYEPLSTAGAIETDRTFQTALDKIIADYQGAARSFPGAVKNEVVNSVNALRTGVMDIGDGLKMTRVLRDDATEAFAKGATGLGKASRKAANAIEDQIERALGSAGQDGAALLKNFRDSRTLMAKAHNVEKAIVEGGGNVNAKVLGAALQRGKPLTGELKTIGLMANNFRDVAGVPQSGWSNPITALDAFGAAGMAGDGRWTSCYRSAGCADGCASVPAWAQLRAVIWARIAYAGESEGAEGTGTPGSRRIARALPATEVAASIAPPEASA